MVIIIYHVSQQHTFDNHSDGVPWRCFSTYYSAMEVFQYLIYIFYQFQATFTRHRTKVGPAEKN